MKSLDLSILETEKIINLNDIFNGFEILETMDLSNLKTPKLESMKNMFFRFSSLTSVSLSNFDAKNIQSFQILFKGCSSLSSIDLSNFNTQNTTNMNFMFYQIYIIEIDMNLLGWNIISNLKLYISNWGNFVSLIYNPIKMITFFSSKYDDEQNIIKTIL